MRLEAGMTNHPPCSAKTPSAKILGALFIVHGGTCVPRPDSSGIIWRPRENFVPNLCQNPARGA